MLKLQRERERESYSPLGYKSRKGGQARGNLPSAISRKGGQRHSVETRRLSDSIGGGSYGE